MNFHNVFDGILFTSKVLNQIQSIWSEGSVNDPWWKISLRVVQSAGIIKETWDNHNNYTSFLKRCHDRYGVAINKKKSLLWQSVMMNVPAGPLGEGYRVEEVSYPNINNDIPTLVNIKIIWENSQIILVHAYETEVLCNGTEKDLSELFWKIMGTTIVRIGFDSDASYGVNRYITSNPLSDRPSPIYGNSFRNFEKIYEDVLGQSQKGQFNSVMFYGPSGTGKSNMVRAILNRSGLKALNLNAEDFCKIGWDTLYAAIQEFKAEAIWVDDIDKVNDSTSELLDLLDNVSLTFPGLFVALTANQSDKFDQGLYRPSRIRTWVKFDLPDREERCLVLRQYLKDLNYPERLLEEDLPRLVDLTDNFSQDYLREIANALVFSSIDKVEVMVKQWSQARCKSSNDTI